MSMDELFENIKEILKTKKLKQSEFVKKEKDLKEKFNDLQKKYNETSYFDVSLFENICDILKDLYNEEVSYNIEELKNMVNAMNELNTISPSFFSFQINRFDETFKGYLNLLGEKINSKLSKTEDEPKRSIEYYASIDSFISDKGFKQILDQDETQQFLDFLDEINITIEQKVLLIMELTKSNFRFIQMSLEKPIEIPTSKTDDLPFEFHSYLASLSPDKAKMCNDIESVIINLNNLLYVDYKGDIDIEKYNKLVELFDALKECYKNYQNHMEYYSFVVNQSDKREINSVSEILEMDYQDLVKIYNQAVDYLEKSVSIDNPELSPVSDSFYSNASKIKNIFVFLDEDDNIQTSGIEQEMLEDEKISVSNMGNLLSYLSHQISEQYFDTGDTRAKGDYNKEFLKRYNVKLKSISNMYLAYSIVGTSYKNDLYDNPQVIFILKVNSKNVSESDINNYYLDALKECNKKQSKIDYVIDLLNTDFSSLTADEAKKKQQEIEEFLRSQDEKLLHFVKTYTSLIGGQKK